MQMQDRTISVALSAQFLTLGLEYARTRKLVNLPFLVRLMAHPVSFLLPHYPAMRNLITGSWITRT